VPFDELVMTAYGRSALVHFGSLSAAFAKVGIEYTAEAEKRKGWQDRIATFLGRVPDTLIAEVVGVSVTTVRNIAAIATSAHLRDTSGMTHGKQYNFFSWLRLRCNFIAIGESLTFPSTTVGNCYNYLGRCELVGDSPSRERRRYM
jgi:hypothetical protein